MEVGIEFSDETKIEELCKELNIHLEKVDQYKVLKIIKEDESFEIEKFGYIGSREFPTTHIPPLWLRDIPTNTKKQ